MHTTPSLLRTFLLVVAVLATATFASAKPKVVIVSMGGTIASKGDTRMNLNNYGGKGWGVAPQVWLDDVPEPGFGPWDVRVAKLKEAAKGRHDVVGKLSYFYCVAASGYCAPAKVDVTIPVTVR